MSRSSWALCCHIQKGGVGKTSVSGTLAAGLALRGKKVIIIDADPQGNVSSWYCTNPAYHELVDVLRQKIPLIDVIQRIKDNLYLIPTFGVENNLKTFGEIELPHNPRVFDFLIQDLKVLGYEYIIVDCSPGFGLLESALIAAVDEVINPLTPEFFSVDGIEIFVTKLKTIEKTTRKTIINNKIVLNMVNKSFANHKAYAEKIAHLNYELFIIPQDRKISECQTAQRSLYEYDPKARSLSSFELLIDAVIKEEI